MSFAPEMAAQTFIDKKEKITILDILYLFIIWILWIIFNKSLNRLIEQLY